MSTAFSSIPAENLRLSQPIASLPRVDAVRAVTREGETISAPSLSKATIRSRVESQVSGTAYQTNQDGDSATFGSKLDQLTDEEKQQIEELKRRDAEVRAHEQAHLATAGGLAKGSPQYEYETGPDGNRYAVGGHVSVDTSEGRTPEETIQRASRIRAAAHAPAEPSSADLQAAAKATRMEAKAKAELREQEREEQTGEDTPDQGGLAQASEQETPRVPLDVYG